MENLKVTLEKIIFYNEQNSYLVARCSSPQYPGLFTLVGNVTEPAPGTVLHIQGEWSIHPKYGKQFKLQSYTKVVPTTCQGIEKYLGSGIIEKIGPGIAARIVKHFGKDTLRIIEKNPERLEEIEGIGPARKASIIAAWQKQKKTRETMLYLHSLGIGPATVNKIYSIYKDEAPRKIQENPYRLAEDIFGIGFKIADRVAQEMGIEKDSPLRIRAGIYHILNQGTEDGHVFIPLVELKEKTSKLLEIEENIVQETILALAARKEIILEDEACYHPIYYSAEKKVAERLIQLASSGEETLPLGWRNIIDWLEEKEDLEFSPEQEIAIQKAITSKVLVITGGPGTGKTTTLKSVVSLFEEFGLRTILAAPTGRAAKRLSQATGKEASTIHRLLGFVPGQGFTKNEKNKLPADAVIIDEVSMVDLLLMNALLKALPQHCRLILVGDSDQLPAVGPGNVLRDIINSQRISVVKLEQVFRQAKKSLIVVNAHRINRGEFPYLGYSGKKDFYFIPEEEPAKVENIVVDLCCRKIPKEFGFNPFYDIQVLSPLYKGVAGVHRLNQILQGILNPQTQKETLKRREMAFRAGDKVMQLKNNYEKEVFNGDIGVVLETDPGEEILKVEFPGKVVLYQGQEINQLTLAYAVSVHKSQGSEYPVIIMPVIISHYLMLQRNLLYTALTRAKKLAIFVGEKRALAIAVKNNKQVKRYTKLTERLSDAGPTG